jgi:cephalosporin hydroxylase
MGGSALWFADILSTFNLPNRVISIDNRASSQVKDARIDFLTGDVHDLGAVLTEATLESLPRPRLVVEDSAHTYASTMAAIRFFDRALMPGDVLVIEDGVLDQLGLSDHYQGGPNRAIEEFLTGNPGRFELMTDYCDIYGVNATYNPNGYLRKLA